MRSTTKDSRNDMTILHYGQEATKIDNASVESIDAGMDYLKVKLKDGKIIRGYHIKMD